MITPLDIENKKFSKQMMNGYSVDEVDDFLDELTIDYTKNYKEVNELRSKVDELNRRFRKCLGHKTPYDIYDSEVLHLT